MNMRRGANRRFARPADDLSQICIEADQAMLSHILRYAFIGSGQTVADKLHKFIDATEVDELILLMPIHDIKAWLKSAEMFAKLM
ncbi:MAG: alkanesulfonate monooxygenase SsuD [Glaciecola sp.]|jgi:alkanesulfonate monooxygenase SsuD/methylene tetrahydromethanopterin reductase-like flavin-dependent oxidoreductase (luciferase family)